MFPSYKQGQQLLELIDSVIAGAVVEITTLTLAAVLRIEAHVLTSGATFQVRNFTARRVNEDVMWSFYGTVMVAGIINNAWQSEGEIASMTIGRYSVTYKTKKQMDDFASIEQILAFNKRYTF